MNNNITSLAQLKKEKRKLKIQKEVSKQLFFESLGNTRKTAIRFLATKVLLPAGAAGVAAWGAKKIFGKNGEEESMAFHSSTANSGSESFFSSLTSKLLPIGLSLLNAYLTKQFVEEDEAE